MILSSRWFPPIFAVLNAIRHVALLAYDYWDAEKSLRHFDAVAYISHDLARPFFEGFGFCGAWFNYGLGEIVALGLDGPAYLLARLIRVAVTGDPECIDALLTPRGNVLTTLCTLSVWFLTGMSIRRMARHHWRTVAKNPVMRVAAGSTILLLLPLAAFFLLAAVFDVFFGDYAGSARAAGLTVWALYASALAAEPLRRWPFHRLRGDATQQP